TPEAPRQVEVRGLARRSAVAAEAGDLGHEPREEDGVPGLVRLLRGEEVLLLVQRRGIDEGRQRGCHDVLAVEDEGEVPQPRLARSLSPSRRRTRPCGR